MVTHRVRFGRGVTAAHLDDDVRHCGGIRHRHAGGVLLSFVIGLSARPPTRPMPFVTMFNSMPRASFKS
jgi:hypothetical protein